MLTTLQGVYKNGRVELLEPGPDTETARVIVTFLPASNGVNLPERGISPQEAAEMRVRLGGMVEDWDDPAIDIYDEI